MENTAEQFHHCMECNNQKRENSKYDVDDTPGTHQMASAFLMLKRLRESGMGKQGPVRPLKVGLFMWRQRRQRRIRLALLQREKAIPLKLLRLAGAQALNGIFLLQQTFFNCLGDARAVRAGVPGDAARLPAVQQASRAAAEHQDKEREQRACAAVGISQAAGVLAGVVQNMGKILVEQRDQDR